MNTILVPTDFSDLAARALRFAGAIARRSGAEVVALYADPFLPPAHFTHDQIPALVDTLAHSRTVARERLERHAASLLDPSIPRKVIIAEQLPVDGILETAERLRPDLIAMGTHGRSGVSRFMLGSVTERVLHQSRFPVVVTRSEGDIPRDPRRILVPTDLRPAAARAVDLASRLAEMFEATVTLLHVVENGSPPSPRAWETFLAGRRTDWIERRVESGNPAERILDAAEDLGADLIALGIEQKRFRDATVLGLNAVRVLRHASVPVLAVPAG